jgi:hypothetical protein
VRRREKVAGAAVGFERSGGGTPGEEHVVGGGGRGPRAAGRGGWWHWREDGGGVWGRDAVGCLPSPLRLRHAGGGTAVLFSGAVVRRDEPILQWRGGTSPTDMWGRL